jgi:hypothetical protein
MLATYPEVFAGGAIIAGLPYGCASNVQQAFEATFTEHGHAAQALGDRVRGASRYRGRWPKISVWHGTCDPIVKPSNGENIIRQWTNVHGLSERPSHQESIENHARRTWSDANGEVLIEAFSISGMAHGVPLATSAEESCGSAGAFFLDVGISSTHHIARFWRLHELTVEMPRAAAPVSARRSQTPTGGGALVVARAAAEGTHPSAKASPAESEERQTRYPFDPNAVIAAAFNVARAAAEGAHPSAKASPAESEERLTRYPFDPNAVIAAAFNVARATAEGAHPSAKASPAESEERQTRYPFDPNAVIAAAFKAAGLPVPEIPAAPPGTPPRVAVGPIIAAALKAAGLVQR